MSGFSRRQFLKMAAVSAAGAVVYSGCTPFPTREDFLTQSPPTIPDDMVTGSDNWYATACRACDAGCGTIVRVYEGRAQKVEGNRDYPVNRGALCARGQTAVQALYHPDRFRGPSRRLGERGQRRFQNVSWDAALADLMPKLREAAANGSLLLITGRLPGHRALVADRFITALGGQRATFETLDQGVLRSAVKRVFGQDQLPVFDIARTQYLLSFGADFLGTWLSPVHYNRAYGDFRQGQASRGYMVQVEPRLSQTGANADEWLSARPGTEGMLALGIAQVLLAQGLSDARAAQAVLGTLGAGALDAYGPERIADTVGIPAERITALARDFGAKRPALALGGDQAAGHSNGLFNLSAIYALNLLVGNVGKPGGVIFNPPSPFKDIPPHATTSFKEWRQLVDRMRSGQPRPVSLALVHGANAVYGLPKALGFADALSKVPYVVSFSSFPDETSDTADLILPDHVALEAWGDDIPDPAPGVSAVALQQPLVKPLYDTRDFTDLLLSFARDLGGEAQRALPWQDYRDLLRSVVQQLPAAGQTAPTGDAFEQFWNGLLQKGGWWSETAAATVASGAAVPLTLPAQPPAPTFAGAAQDFPFNLVVYPQIGIGAGEAAHLPWMQATPEPTTSAAWQSWVEINPATAEMLKLAKGDVVTVESPNGSVDVPVYPYPAIPPDIVAVPLGQGHVSGGQWAKDRGVNPLDILSPTMESETGALAWGSTRVRLRRTGKSAPLPTYEYPGGTPTEQLEPGDVVQISKE